MGHGMETRGLENGTNRPILKKDPCMNVATKEA